MKDTLKSIKKLIGRSSKTLLTAHIRLDGDALGSELALYYALKDLGKDPAIINDSPIPRVYKFLVREVPVREVKTAEASPPEPALERSEGTDAGGGAVLSSSGEDKGFDLVISVDTPVKDRLGKAVRLFSDATPIINIDHHPPQADGGNFGTVNWVDTSKCSTGEMVYDLLRSAGWKITPRIAEALYVAIVTDTNRFTNPNTTAETLRVAAHLIDCGADPTEIGNHLYKANTYGQLQLAARATETMKFFGGKRIATIWLTREMMKEARTPSIDTQDFPDIPASVEGVSVGVLLRELGEPNKVKVSLRSRDGVDVNRIAQKFGGGGHKGAAGCELQGTIEEVQGVVVKEIEKALEER
ncbi:MAG: bifunctional oligoribonuclease/PAP phosphatase NrnA [Candidatus Brocadiaceae bacterium]|nr:bifunctional oligoribonuclease/PAP phosphatase NrnA [Candidatus Brocadiaceae bacterium]